MKHYNKLYYFDSYIVYLVSFEEDLAEYVLQTSYFSVLSADEEKFSDKKSIWIWSGSTLDQLKKSEDPNVKAILETADILVDGPFIEKEKNLNLRFRGSGNQRIINLKTGEIEE